MGVFIIAEAGVNHNGSTELALRLCDAAKAAGADAVKFQTWKTENIATKNTSLAEYQAANTGKENSQYDMLKELELAYGEFVKIKEYCDKIGICFLSTPDDEESLEFLLTLEMPFIKIGSGEVTNIPYLRKIGSTGRHIILSTGMSNIAEVDTAYRTLKESGAASIALLHCTTNYPCPFNEVNLRAMITLRDTFKCGTGYSDHTSGIAVSIAAVALGAEIIEKHFTLDKNMVGPDHKASLDPRELTEMVNSIRTIEAAMGNGIKCPNPSERNNAKVVQKRIVAKRKILPGEVFSENNLTLKRCDGGEPAVMWDIIIGRTATSEYEKDEPVCL